jgi:hypothetical protein
MMLTGRNEWIAIGILILYIAFVPCPYAMKEFFGTPIGKAVALGVVIYAWKYVSAPVAILLLVAFLRSGSMREYLDETGVSSDNNYKCPDGFMYSTEKKMFAKGEETKEPECTDSTMKWSAADGMCVAKPVEPTTTAGGPAGGTTPGAMAAKNEIANSMPPTPPVTESFTPYGGKDKQEFAPL